MGWQIRKQISLGVHTFAHFSVDFACFFMLFAGFAKAFPGKEALAVGFLLYNAAAFGLQPLIGYVCDTRKNIPSALAGCLLVITGLCLFSVPWLALSACALGNACFHVGGGIDSLVNANGKLSRSGIFVSGGALGVVLGTLSGKGGLPGAWLPYLLLAVSAAMIIIVSPFPSRPIVPVVIRFQTAAPGRSTEMVLLLCVLSVIIRSLGGAIVPAAWRAAPWLAVMAALAAFAGKAAGGFAADRFGARLVGVASLMASLPFLVWGYGDPLLCSAGFLLFNMSMPVTLGAIYSVLPGHPGLSFGLTTLALLCGIVPLYFLAVPYASLVIAILIILSSAALYFALDKGQGGIAHG
jgi:MFS transporter, FSR family, fosmidomycin resistance protein